MFDYLLAGVLGIAPFVIGGVVVYLFQVYFGGTYNAGFISGYQSGKTGWNTGHPKDLALIEEAEEWIAYVDSEEEAAT